jgi:hypothetical protein
MHSQRAVTHARLRVKFALYLYECNQNRKSVKYSDIYKYHVL